MKDNEKHWDGVAKEPQAVGTGSQPWQDSLGDEQRKQFHPAFCAAIRQIFEHDGACSYRYEEEFNLNSMPNRIDFLITKDGGGTSGNGMGQIFRKYNIFEYKSPGQGMGQDSYHAVMAYAHLFALYVDSEAFDDTTLSLVREGRPVKLMEELAGMGFSITRSEEGIYQLRKAGHPDMQVIVTGELGERYFWLKALSRRLTPVQFSAVAASAAREMDPQGRIRIQSILDLAYLLNKDKEWMKELIGMGAFRDVFKEEFEQRDNTIAEQRHIIEEQERAIAEKDSAIAEKDSAIADAIAEKDSAIADAIAEKDSAIAEKDNTIAEKDNTIAEKDSAIAEKDGTIEKQEKLINEMDLENSKLRQELDRLRKLMGRPALF